PRSAPPVLATTPGKLHVHDGQRQWTVDLAAPTPRGPWFPSARVDVDGLSVVIEDGDPHRACHYWPPTGRLDEPTRRAWRQSLEAAWRSVLADAPEHAAGMTAGLRVITPLVAAPDGTQRSSYARHAFGAVAVAPTAADALAVLLVHEFQHVKLGALIDIIDLYDPGYRELLTVGWRPDPRPIEMVLHGTYAHLAIADIWRARAERSGDDTAAATFRQYRDWTTQALAKLAATRALTPAGARLLELMNATIASWR
ncbi:MAG: FxsB family radical SAM/SPASM domain protein, partial [Micromonosporaceae bacterium]|nr:FxsB family radical SAM/SPASM domain protein [Micromonosporaceae bacterium]